MNIVPETEWLAMSTEERAKLLQKLYIVGRAEMDQGKEGGTGDWKTPDSIASDILAICQNIAGHDPEDLRVKCYICKDIGFLPFTKTVKGQVCTFANPCRCRNG